MTFQAVRTISLPVASATVIGQRNIVQVDSNGNAIETTAATQMPAGIALEASANGDSVPIPVALLDGGIVEVVAGAAVTRGGEVMSDSAGRAINATGATARVIGTALDAAAAADEVIRVLTGSAGFAAQA